MKLGYIQASILAVLLIVPAIKGLEFLGQLQQGVGAAADSVVATRDTVDAVVKLVNQVNTSVSEIQKKVNQLVNTASDIVTNDAQKSIKNSFGAITHGIDISTELVPTIQKLSDVLSVVTNNILPTIAKYPGVPSEVNREVSKISFTVKQINTEIANIKSSLNEWIPKIKSLSKSLGDHAVEITKQSEGAVADIKKLF